MKTLINRSWKYFSISLKLSSTLAEMLVTKSKMWNVTEAQEQLH